METDVSKGAAVEMCRLSVGERGRVMHIGVEGDFKRRLSDLGLVDGTVVECVGRSPMGDPVAFLIRGAVRALRSEDCRAVTVRRLGEDE